jgi:hypothetical protein
MAETLANRSRLSSAIERTLAAWIRASKAVDAAEINSGAARGGCCSDFASEVVEHLGGQEAADRMDLEEIAIDNLMVVDPDDAFGRPLDRPLLAKHWPKVCPPDGLGWDDLDQLSQDANFFGGTHVWLTMEGRHYDAEAPDGVDNLFDLPFFVRVVSSWVAKKGVAPHV